MSLANKHIAASDIKRAITQFIKENFKITPIWDEMKEGYKKPSFFVYFLNLQKIPTSRDSVMYVFPVEIQYQGKSNLDALQVAEQFGNLVGDAIVVKGKHLVVRDFAVSIEAKNAWIDFEIEVVTTKGYPKNEGERMRSLHVRYDASGDYDKED